MSRVWTWVVAAATLIAVLAAFTRIVSLPESPKLIRNAADALAKLFNGVFS